MTDDPYEFGKPTADDWPRLAQMISLAFAHDMTAEQIERRRPFFRPEESDVILHHGEFVAHSALLDREVAVPGGVVPAAHVSAVVVSPTHRRRGLLSRLMTGQLRAVRDAGRQPIAMLWASEGRIYQRFGYGCAFMSGRYSINPREVRVHPGTISDGTLRLVPKDEGSKIMQEVYGRAWVHRPGWSSRDTSWWEDFLLDPEDGRHGWTGQRILIYGDRAGEPAGYAVWRTKLDWDNGGPIGAVQVLELVSTTPEAYAALWNFLLSVDLTRKVDLRFASTAEPLLYMVDEPRRLHSSMGDGLWVRVVDVPAALTARRYAAPLDMVIEITDHVLPENAGRWRLTIDRDGWATCEPSTDPPDLACDVADLGALFFGGTAVGSLADAGRVRERTSGALLATAAAFTWHRAPSGIEIF